MTESMPLTLVRMQQLNRGLTEKVLDKAASDPQWKQQLIDDPEAAMRQANFPELQQIGQTQGDEVRGQESFGGFPNYFWNCAWYSWYQYQTSSPTDSGYYPQLR